MTLSDMTGAKHDITRFDRS